MVSKLSTGQTIVLANLGAGLSLVVASLVVVAWLIPEFVAGSTGSHDNITPGFMPRVSAVAMGLFGAVIALQAFYALFRAELVGDSDEESEENENLIFGRAEISNVVIAVVLSAVYVFLMQIIGFMASSAILLFILIYAAGFRNIPLALGISVAFPAGLEQLLWWTLLIRLPEMVDVFL